MDNLALFFLRDGREIKIFPIMRTFKKGTEKKKKK